MDTVLRLCPSQFAVYGHCLTTLPLAICGLWTLSYDFAPRNLWFMDTVLRLCPSQFVVYGHCLTTLPLTICGLWTLSYDFAPHNLWFMDTVLTVSLNHNNRNNMQTITWLSSLPVNTKTILVVTSIGSGIVSLFPHVWDLGPHPGSTSSETTLRYVSLSKCTHI